MQNKKGNFCVQYFLCRHAENCLLLIDEERKTCNLEIAREQVLNQLLGVYFVCEFRLTFDELLRCFVFQVKPLVGMTFFGKSLRWIFFPFMFFG